MLHLHPYLHLYYCYRRRLCYHRLHGPSTTRERMAQTATAKVRGTVIAESALYEKVEDNIYVRLSPAFRCGIL